MPRFVFPLFAVALLAPVGCGPKPTDPAPAPAVPTEPAPPTAPKPSGGTLRGAVTHPGTKGQTLTAGYVELSGIEWVGDVVALRIPAADDPASVESDPAVPHKAKLSFDKGVTFEFTRLPPGTYFLFAKLDDGPAVWAKEEVKADATVTHDFKLEAGKGGAVEVTTPADYAGELRLAPADLIPADDASFVGVKMATQLSLGGKAKAGKVTIPDVPPGKYTLFAFPGEGPVTARGAVEVTAGKTATAELEKERKK